MRSEGVSFIFNTPNAESWPGYRALGWRSVGRVPLLVRPTALLPGGLARRATRSRVATAFSLDGLPYASALLDEASLGPILQAEAGTRGEHYYRTLRTPSYLRWRYDEVPDFDYRAVWDSEGTDGAAVIFTTRLRRGMREVKLCEILLGEGDRSATLAKERIGALVRGVGADYMLAVAARGSRERAVLRECGFLPADPVAPRLVARPLSADRELPDLLRMRSWRLSLGDLEIF